MRFCSLLILLPVLTLGFVACESTSDDPPPPPRELIGGPCDYDSTPGIAIVSDADSDTVRFLIDGKIVPYARQDLPSDYDYYSGEQYQVIEKHITKGTCTPYILEIVGPVNTPRQSAQERRLQRERTEIRPNYNPL